MNVVTAMVGWVGVCVCVWVSGCGDSYYRGRGKRRLWRFAICIITNQAKKIINRQGQMQSNHNVKIRKKKQTKKERKKPDTLVVAKMRFKRKKRNAEIETEGGKEASVFLFHDLTFKPLLYSI